MFSVIFALIGSFTTYNQITQINFFYNNSLNNTIESSNRVVPNTNSSNSYTIMDNFGIDVFDVYNNNYGFINRASISKNVDITLNNFTDIKEIKIHYENFFLNLTTRGLEYEYICHYTFMYSNNNTIVKSFNNNGLYVFPNWSPGVEATGYINTKGYFNYTSELASYNYNKGMQEGQKIGLKIENIINNLLEPIDRFLQIEIYPGIKLWYIVAVPLFFSLLQFFLSLWR